MGFQSKTYSLSDEVVEAIERLRKQYGSPNKGLKVVLCQNPEISLDKKENIDKQTMLCRHCGVTWSDRLLCQPCFLNGHRGVMCDAACQPVKDLKYEPDS